MLLCVDNGIAFERGSILYHTSQDGLIYGQTDVLELPCSVLQVAFGELGSGHVALYIGDDRIIHAVATGVEETDSSAFITQEDGENGVLFIGAKIPANFSNHDQWPESLKEQLIVLAKEQVGKPYDIQFRHQKGEDGKFTCVGLVEFVFEQVGYDITPSGYYQGGPGGKTYTQTYDCISTGFFDWEGTNTFSQNVEFSKFEHPLADVLNVGMIHDDNRYLFFPYTQYLQESTVNTGTDTQNDIQPWLILLLSED